MPIPTLRRNNQVTLPTKLTRELGLHIGDAITFMLIDGKIVIEPIKAAESTWLTPDIIAEIEASDAGQRESFDSVDDLLASLHG